MCFNLGFQTNTCTMGKARSTPRCPGDPAEYTLVRSRRGNHWRRNRGTVKPAKLNPAFEANSAALSKASPVAKFILDGLRDYIHDLDICDVHPKICGAMVKENFHKGMTAVSCLKGFDFQPSWPLGSVVETGVSLTKDTKAKRFISEIRIPEKRSAVRVRNNLFTGYCFKLVLLHGNFNLKSAETICVSSPVYRGTETETICRLEMPYDKIKNHYLLCLRVETYEEEGLSANRKTRGLKVIDAGSLREATY